MLCKQNILFSLASPSQENNTGLSAFSKCSTRCCVSTTGKTLLQNQNSLKITFICTSWSVRSRQIHKWLLFVFESLNLNVIIPYRCLLHSSYCGGCSYQGFIGFVFFLFITFLERELFLSRVSFFFFVSTPTFLPVQTPALETLFILVQLLLTRHSNQTGTVYWTTRCQVTHSLSHSHKPASPLPSAPFAVFAKRHLSLRAWREDLWPFKQTQALNGLSVCAAVG